MWEEFKTMIYIFCEGEDKYMKNNHELISHESNGVFAGVYLDTENNTIIEAIGTSAVPGESRAAKYRGTVIWSQDIPITTQVMSIKKILCEHSGISNKEILHIAREKTSWTFGEFFGVDAAHILEKARMYSLNIEMIDIDSGIKLII